MTDAIQRLNQVQRVFAYDFEGKRFDVGEKLGFITTTIEFALQHNDLKEQLKEFMRVVLEKENSLV